MGAVSTGLVVAYAFAFAWHRHEVDLDVYLMGGSHLFGGHLYDVRAVTTHLSFTYTPFAALLFGPLSLFPEQGAELLWGAVNVVALAALVAISLRAVRPDMDRRQVVRWSLILMAPALWLDPVRLTFSFGQIDVVLPALILADLTGVVRVGSKTVPRGVLTGLSAAVKLIPLIFAPYLFLTRQFRAAWVTVVTFVVCGLGMAALVPGTSWLFWTKYVSDAHRVGGSVFVSNQSLRAVMIRLHHGLLGGGRRVRSRRPGIGRVGLSFFLAPPRDPGLCDDGNGCLADHLGPSHGLGHPHHLVVGIGPRSPGGRADLGHRRCRVVLAGAHLVSALRQWTGVERPRLANPPGQLVLRGHDGVSDRRGGHVGVPASGWIGQRTSSGPDHKRRRPPSGRRPHRRRPGVGAFPTRLMPSVDGPPRSRAGPESDLGCRRR